MTITKQQYVDAPLAALEIGENVRRDVGDIDELVESIKRFGILEPLIGYLDDDGTTIQVLMGQRRLAAARKARLPQVPVLLRPRPPERDRVLMQLAENFDRADMSPIDEAIAYAELTALGMKQHQIAKAVRRSTAIVSRRIRLLSLPDCVRLAVDVGSLPEHEALAIPTGFFDDPDAVKRLAKCVMSGAAAVQTWVADEMNRQRHNGHVPAKGKYRVFRNIGVDRDVYKIAGDKAIAAGVPLRDFVERLIRSAP